LNPYHQTPPLTSSSDSRPWYSIIQAFSAGIAFLLSTALGVFLFLYGLWENFIHPFDAASLLSFWLPASAFLFLGLLFLPSVFLGLGKWFGWHLPILQHFKSPSPLLLFFLFLVVVLIGNQLANATSFMITFLPVFHVLGISLPVAFFLSLALHNLPGQSLQRRWGAFHCGMGLAPIAILILESLALIGFLLLIGLWIAVHPDLVQEVSHLLALLKQSRPNPEKTLNLMQPYLAQPWVVTAILIFSALLIPMIEEAIKPLGVYLLLGKIRGEVDGFIIGALSGGGYALLESMMFSNSGMDWAQTILSRSATAVIHIFTAALMGSAIAQAWQDRRYSRLFLAYGCSIFFHGSWNGMAMLYSLQAITEGNQGVWQNPFIHNLANLAPFMILLLFLYTVSALWLFRNLILKQSGKITLLTDQDTSNEDHL